MAKKAGKQKTFQPWSCVSRESAQYKLGAPTDRRRWYQRDIDQITHSTGFRKLQRKSQLLSEKDSRSRSRMIHTIEVSRIATEISGELKLSKELTEAICLAHDIGTSPYGYIGNNFLQNKIEKSGDPTSCKFSHELVGAYMLLYLSQKNANEPYIDTVRSAINKKSRLPEDIPGVVRVKIRPHNATKNGKHFPQFLYASKKGDGTSDDLLIHEISPEIIDGVYNHGEHGVPGTLEGQVVRFADNIAYLSQDIEDLIVTNIITEAEIGAFLNEDEPLSYDGHTMSWHEIHSDDSLGKLSDAFSSTRGRRIAAFVNRYVRYNLKRVEENKLDFQDSHVILDENGKAMKIPVLKCDPGMQFIIDFLWDFISQKYKSTLIQTSNAIQLTKMQQLWEILGDDKFNRDNQTYRDFLQSSKQRGLYEGYSDTWRRAFFISHLSWQEVDMILDSYHERNNTFALDISI